eukprot:GHRR01018675.1.p2 GENE.GHRR01018675.1~~GHRR01018675.1.p2  ORF type:complete len:110 (-),score=30.31 GHRR01018675.1:3080-3409(-)
MLAGVKQTAHRGTSSYSSHAVAVNRLHQMIAVLHSLRKDMSTTNGKQHAQDNGASLVQAALFYRYQQPPLCMYHTQVVKQCNRLHDCLNSAVVAQQPNTRAISTSIITL